MLKGGGISSLLYTFPREPRESSEYLIGSDTNADSNPHEQQRTRAMRKQTKYAYLQEFLSTGEQPRH